MFKTLSPPRVPSYLGYANELGESFKSFISTTTYRGTYAVAIAYGKLFNRLSFARKMLASVTIPGMIINRAVATTQWTLDSYGSQAEPSRIPQGCVSRSEGWSWDAIVSTCIDTCKSVFGLLLPVTIYRADISRFM
eukprot:1184233-Prorocentrum_minimum.AAC.2